jgi:hypothetical protein
MARRAVVQRPTQEKFHRRTAFLVGTVRGSTDSNLLQIRFVPPWYSVLTACVYGGTRRFISTHSLAQGGSMQSTEGVFQLFTNGEWAGNQSGESFAVYDPSAVTKLSNGRRPLLAIPNTRAIRRLLGGHL